MALNTSDLNIKPYSKSYALEDLAVYRRALAKRANQRLVRLERATSVLTGKAYSENDSYSAMKYALDYIRRTGKQGKLRYSESKGYKSEAELRAEIANLQKFLQAKTSTVKGIRQVERKRIEKFKSKGIDLADTKEFYDFLNDKTFEDLSKAYSSELLIEIYDEYSDGGLEQEELLNIFRDFRNRQANPKEQVGLEYLLERLKGEK